LFTFIKDQTAQSRPVFQKITACFFALFSLGHGLNDAQKVMGIIGAALIYYHVEMLHDPIYLNLESADVLIILHSIISGFLWFHLLIALGTMSGLEDHQNNGNENYKSNF
jgi:PiT family inorganic phosphate transporter